MTRGALPCAALGASLVLGSCASQHTSVLSPDPMLPLIPAPQSAALAPGFWTPGDTVRITTEGAPNADLRALAELATTITSSALSRPAIVALGATPRAGGLHLAITGASEAAGESYRLEVSPEGARIAAATPAGVFYGLQSLRQLIEGSAPTYAVRAARISDAPRFSWRGLHLDVGRHFFTVDFIKRYIDLMARYKLNTFHWHLTEDQGWRIEIKKHPRLTTVGSCRRETIVAKNFDPYVGDGITYCGFYTQDEIRDVVAYAAARYVIVVPEIEMPGHSKAALAAYPELACTPGPFEVRTTWGVDEDIYCPSEQTFAFLEDVLSEVMALFPSRYIHIGGDEAPKTRWKASPLAQEVIRREGLKDEHELQSWFIRRIERFLLQHDRRLIGWDEILEGGLAPQATVMSWRGTSGGIAAARQGHDVVMTPTQALYFDYYQGDARFEPLAIGGNLPLDVVYAFEPVPDALTADQARHILGAQGNVWTEYLKTPAMVEYMTYPRAIALAEVVWSPRQARNWDSFVARLPNELRSLDRMNVSYRLPHVQGLENDRLTLDDGVTIHLRSLFHDAEIRYTTDGTDPTRTSPRYAAPFTLPVNAQGTRVTARAFSRDGRASAPRAATFTRTSYRSADALATETLAPGLKYAYFEASLGSARIPDSLRATREGVVSAIARRGDERAEQYALRFGGYVRVPSDALYEFALASDDGSLLSIGERVVVDNDGFHGVEERSGMIALRAGYHPVAVTYFQGGGGAELSLRYRVGDGAWADVPSDWLVHKR